MIMYLPFFISLLSCYIYAQQDGDDWPTVDPTASTKEPSRNSMAYKIINGEVKMNAVLFTCAAIHEPSSCRMPTVLGQRPLAYNERVFMEKEPGAPPTSAPPMKGSVPPAEYNPTELLDELRDNWITEETFKAIKAQNFNAVKIKFGFWLVEPDENFISPEPFMHRIMRWAAVYDLGVYLSFAGVPGCQNFQPVANCPNDAIRWGDGGYLLKNIQTIEIIADRYIAYKSFIGINLLYEPSVLGATNTMLKSYYTQVIESLQKVKYDRLVMISPLVEKRFDENDIKEWCGFVKDKPRVLISESSYFYWEAAFDTEKKISDEIARRGKILATNKDCPLIVDEWSMAFKLDLSKKKLQALAKQQQEAYSNALNGTVFGPFKTTTNSNEVDNFSYTSLIKQGILQSTSVPRKP